MSEEKLSEDQSENDSVENVQEAAASEAEASVQSIEDTSAEDEDTGLDSEGYSDEYSESGSQEEEQKGPVDRSGDSEMAREYQNTPGDERRLLSEHYPKTLKMLEELYVYKNMSGRILFMKKNPLWAPLIFSEELMTFDREGADDRKERAKYEKQAAIRHHKLYELIKNIEAKSDQKGLLNVDYVTAFVHKFGRELSLQIYDRKLVDHIIPPALGEAAEVPPVNVPSPLEGAVESAKGALGEMGEDGSNPGLLARVESSADSQLEKAEEVESDDLTQVEEIEEEAVEDLLDSGNDGEESSGTTETDESDQTSSESSSDSDAQPEEDKVETDDEEDTDSQEQTTSAEESPPEDEPENPAEDEEKGEDQGDQSAPVSPTSESQSTAAPLPPPLSGDGASSDGPKINAPKINSPMINKPAIKSD